MSDADVTEIAAQTMMVAAKVAAPILLTALLVGFLISLFQAATQIQEPTLSFVPKMIVPSAAHAPPRNDPAAQITTGAAVASSLIVFSWLSAEKPTDFPSGEKKGMYAPSVAGSAVVVS